MQAVGGADHNISLISIVEARVVSLFKGDAHSSVMLALGCKAALPSCKCLANRCNLHMQAVDIFPCITCMSDETWFC